ncbi:MAG TPA: SDR family oxidoreductase [Mucilaginibacter sp.]|nr:SDR family oxidoreductase [Mucilaginibacter sp.]
MKKEKSLAGKVAVITGGGQGVGFGIAQEFIENGASVVITGRRQSVLDEAVALLGPKSSAVMADVSKLAEMEAMFGEVIARHGRLDTVVANAITNANGPLGTITEEQWDHTFNTNAKGVLFSVQPALPLMKAGGTFVIIGSTASVQPPPSMSLYGGAKAAVRCMIRAWIQDIQGSGIRINVLTAGAIDTPSLRSALESASGADKVDEAVKKMGEGNPIGRLGQPRDIGKAAVFLASDDSGFITGIELFADGGMAQV